MSKTVAQSRWLATGLSFFLITSCVSRPIASTTLTLFAAASLTDVLPALGAAYIPERTDVQLRYNFAGSSTLATQINEGGGADALLSANLDQIETVRSAGNITDEVVPFASNELALVVPADNPAGIQSLDDLTAPGVRLVIANEGVPIRIYTDRLLINLAESGFDADGVYANIVSEESNVRQVLAKIALGEADAAFVYSTDLNANSDVVSLPLIPAAHRAGATYYAAAIRGDSEAHAADFITFLQSPPAVEVLTEFGFSPPPDAPR